MGTPDRDTSIPRPPEHLRGLTYTDATPEQVAEARQWARDALAAADAHAATPEHQQRIAAARTRLGITDAAA